MARIGLIDVDGRHFPNLALMKISAWHKVQGDDVLWYDMFAGHCDKVYMSKVFSFSPDYQHPIDADEIVKGGSGYCISLVDGREVFEKSLNEPLPHDIEHMYPDYSLYPRYTKDTAYGFLTRGCPRGCDFCIVAKKEGKRSIKVADLSEFWRGQKNICLLDPNILASIEWENLFEQLRCSGAQIDITQGLDIRLMTEAKAQALASLRMNEVHFAWDRYEDKDEIVPKLKMFAEIAGVNIKRHKHIVYVLVNFDTELAEDLERIYMLRDMGYMPYVMIYDRANAEKKYRSLARWVNNRFIFFSCKTFEEYNNI